MSLIPQTKTIPNNNLILLVQTHTQRPTKLYNKVIMSHTKTLQENVYTRKRKRLKVEQPVFKKYFAL